MLESRACAVSFAWHTLCTMADSVQHNSIAPGAAALPGIRIAAFAPEVTLPWAMHHPETSVQQTWSCR